MGWDVLHSRVPGLWAPHLFVKSRGAPESIQIYESYLTITAMT